MKQFNDFMAQMDTKDYSKLAEHLANKYPKNTFSEGYIALNLELTCTILREYHNWLHQD